MMAMSRWKVSVEPSPVHTADGLGSRTGGAALTNKPPPPPDGLSTQRTDTNSQPVMAYYTSIEPHTCIPGVFCCVMEYSSQSVFLKCRPPMTPVWWPHYIYRMCCIHLCIDSSHNQNQLPSQLMPVLDITAGKRGG